MIRLSDQARILVTRTDRIGDLVASTPVFELIKKQYPQSYLAVCVFREHRELVEKNPFIDEVILYEKKGREKNWLGQFCFARQIRAKKFDAVIHLHATNRMHGMAWLAGIPVRIGYTRRAAWALTHAHPYDKKEGLRHESEYLFRLCSAALPQPQADFGQLLPYVPVTQGNRLSVSNLLQHFGIHEDEPMAVIHPSASDTSKMWPAEKFSELIKLWKPAPAKHWIVIGGEEASAQAQKIKNLSDVPVVDLCGRLSLGMLAALFERAAIVVSNDSGPAHIAAAVGAPTVSIFGRWQPGLNAERWRPIGKKTAIVTPQIEGIPLDQRQFTYIEEISAEQVLKAAGQVLA